MIHLIPIDKLSNYHNILPIQYNNYLCWLDDESENFRYHYIATMNVDIRPKEQWNEKGREIYDRDRLHQHAEYINHIIHELELYDFVIQHEYSPSIWFPTPIIAGKPIDDKIQFVQSINTDNIDINSFSGGFKLEGEPYTFLKTFVDYPFLLRYKNIDIFSTQVDLVVKIGHHLSIDFVTLNKTFMSRIISLCKRMNLRCTGLEI